MIKRMVSCLLSTGIILCISGCTDENSQETNLVLNSTHKNIENSHESFFPEEIHGSSENVVYDIILDIPDSIKNGSYVDIQVEDIQYSDPMSARQLFEKNRAISTEEVIETDESSPKEHIWLFDDGSYLNAGGSSFIFTSVNNSYYTNAFSFDGLNDKDDQLENLELCSQSECLENVLNSISQMGYANEFLLTCMPVTYQTLEKIESHLTPEGDDDISAYKAGWTDDDSAYILSGYQTFDGIPIYNELMTLSQEMAHFNSSNAPVQAIYTSRGFEKLLISWQYNFTKTDNTYKLLPIDKIIETVRTKLDNIITDNKFNIDCGKFLLMVKLNQEQAYECFPIWYFEATQGSENTVILVNARTGKEISVGM